MVKKANEAEADRFSPGDLVKLKSGGPVMTVKRKYSYIVGREASSREYTCQWFGGKKLESGVFNVDSLDPVSGESDANTN